MKATFFLGLLQLLFATCAGAPSLTPEASTQLAVARRHLAEKDPDSALAITDKLRKGRSGPKCGWLLATAICNSPASIVAA